MWQKPGMWLIRCPRCGTWHWWKWHTVRDCYTIKPYREE